MAVVYISHRLEEIREIGDRVTVLKDGHTVATGLPARTTPTTELVALMTGRRVEYLFPPRPADDAFDDRPVIRRMSSRVGVSLTGRSVATLVPSLSTVMRSPIWRISSSRWEM